MSYNLSLILIIIIEILVVVLAVYMFARLWTKGSRLRRLAQNIALLSFTLLLLLTVMEVFFAFFFIQSDGINFTLTSQKWHERYWKPINSMGYRDYEWRPEDLVERRTIIVAGDSFVAGWGIAEIEDRFSNRLGELLTNDYAVMTVAQNGWGVLDELAALKEYPHRSDILILSHYINDIAPSGAALGISGPDNLLVQPSGWLKSVVANSHLINYVYWRLYRWQAYDNPLKRLEVQTYQSYLRDLFENPDVWQVHSEALNSIYEWSEGQSQSLIIVVFPDMLRVNETRDLGDKVVAYYRNLGVPVLDVAELVSEIPARDRIVNTVDTHASVEVQILIAEALKPMLLAIEE